MAYAAAWNAMSAVTNAYLRNTYPTGLTHAEAPALAELLKFNTPTTQLLHYGWGIIVFAMEEVGGMRLSYFIDGWGAHVSGQPVSKRALRTGDARPAENNQYSYYHNITLLQALAVYDWLNPDTHCTLVEYLNREIDLIAAAAPPPQLEA
jgi:hypothetical protein